MNAADRLTLRRVPKGLTLTVRAKLDASCVYLYTREGVLYAVAYRGTAASPEWEYRFRSAEEREATARQFLASVESHHARKMEARAKVAGWQNPLQVGAVLYTSWGYDQTNVDFYVATRVSGTRVYVRRIASEYEETGSMAGHVWPVMPITPVGPETAHRATSDGGTSAVVHIHGHRAHIEDGRKHYTSSYA